MLVGCLTCGGRTELPSGFVHVTERVPDAILEARYHSTYNFVGKRIDGYVAPEAILTEEAAAALRKASFYPELDKSVLFDQGYIAAKSGHSRGSTVDLTLVEAATGREVDMGGTFDYFGRRSHSDFTEGLSPVQVANRRLLREAMVAAGFKPLAEEWWHFTLKDEPYPDRYFDFPVR